MTDSNLPGLAIYRKGKAQYMRILKISENSQIHLLFCDSWYRLLLMDTKSLLKLTELTSRQLEYLLNQIDVLKRDKTQGKPRDYSINDIAVLKVIVQLRKKGVGIRDINKIMNVIDDNPDKAATIAVYPMRNKKPFIKLELCANMDTLVSTVEDHFFTGQDSKPDLFLIADGAWIDEHPMYEETVRLTNEDQLELDLKEEAVQHEQ